MASVLYQSIETLSRDKGIEPAVVVGAVEDAIALATRKYYKTQENMRAEMDRETGEIRAYVFKTVVESPDQVEDDINQMTLEQARELAPNVFEVHWKEPRGGDTVTHVEDFNRQELCTNITGINRVPIPKIVSRPPINSVYADKAALKYGHGMPQPAKRCANPSRL